jgi:hypothetical protein
MERRGVVQAGIPALGRRPGQDQIQFGPAHDPHAEIAADIGHGRPPPLFQRTSWGQRMTRTVWSRMIISSIRLQFLT